jgi:hypothetical protein
LRRDQKDFTELLQESLEEMKPTDSLLSEPDTDESFKKASAVAKRHNEPL